MAIKTKVTETKPNRINYPSLMISNYDGIIVLMTGTEKGTVLNPSTSIKKIGYTGEGWIMDNFRDFEGEITLSNK